MFVVYSNWWSRHFLPPWCSFGNYDSHIQIITTLTDPLRKSIHFLHQYMSPFATLPSVLFYKEGLYISKHHSTKPWCGWLPVDWFATSSLGQSRNNHIYISSHSLHFTLISTSLFSSIFICHITIWAQIAIPPWSFHSPHPIGTRSSRTTTASKYSVPTGAGADNTMTMEVLVFEWGSHKATLYWCQEFQDLIGLKGLDAAAKFTKANWQIVVILNFWGSSVWFTSCRLLVVKCYYHVQW
jgi:hypothetical protein